uniref:Uncharacterized protein n=1 Tax=Siphoviridae sp. ctuOq1 TaxID=2825713 RepID=A0A8S5UZ32_9CAUD|nr:MAG TPA: hypothetical protein [Siphoviridae sp. ctuOq1]
MQAGIYSDSKSARTRKSVLYIYKLHLFKLS